jgi:hypothetical protein
MTGYFGPDGAELTLTEWSEMFEARAEDMGPESWWRRETRISDEVRVSTVWLGLNHRLFGDGPPLIWETMIFGGEHDEGQWRYSTRQAALDDHERIIAAIRAGEDP